MTHRKRTTISIETRHRTVFRRSDGHAVAWCERCREEVPMLKPEEIAGFVRITAGDFFRRVESGELHFIEMDDGARFICSNQPAEEASPSGHQWRYQNGEARNLRTVPLASAKSFLVRVHQLVMNLWRVRP